MSARFCTLHARSRNSENNTGKFPDIVANLPGLLTEGTQSVVLDCEAVGWERETGRILPFQVPHPCFEQSCYSCACCSVVSVPLSPARHGDLLRGKQ